MKKIDKITVTERIKIINDSVFRLISLFENKPGI